MTSPLVRKAALAATLLGLLQAAGEINPARADPPPDVVVLCEPTLEHVVSDLGASWRRETGIPVRVITSPTWAILEQISHNISGDLVIGEGDEFASAAVRRKLIKPETVQRLWRNELVVVANTAETHGSAAPHLASLAGKAPIAMADPATAPAGAYGMKALEALGLWDAVRASSIGVVDTPDASYLLAQGKVQLALLYTTDVAANPSFVVEDRLSRESYPPVVYWIATTHEASSPNAAKFVDFLRQPAPQSLARRDGLEVIP